MILSIKKRTKTKNKYNIEYPNIDFAFFELNYFFYNSTIHNINNYNKKLIAMMELKNVKPTKLIKYGKIITGIINKE